MKAKTIYMPSKIIMDKMSPTNFSKKKDKKKTQIVCQNILSIQLGLPALKWKETLIGNVGA